MTSKNILAAISILLLLPACHKKSDKPTVQPPVKVTVMQVGSQKGNFQKEYSGIVASSDNSTVSFSVGGTITELYASEGQKVAKGQILGKVNNGDYINAYNIAEAQLDEARDAYNRLKKLHDANALPEIKWVEIQQKLKQAQNSAELARRALDDATLHSPVAGTVTKKYADVGQTVMPVEPVYEITSLKDLTVNISVGENEIGLFNVGERAGVVVSSLSDSVINGKITEKASVADPLTRSYTMKVKLDRKNPDILPGMLARVKFEKTDAEPEGFSLPSQAVVLNDDNRWCVWVVKDSIAERRFVETGAFTSDGVSIKTGLQPGDLVIVEGIRKVGTGSKVIPLMK
ncbi:MAG: efflux RND transporter periplasmic adaptor subunit [Muribaculaceae bacterium]|nr:efflux RND transporter periplasmic adaptor subunit [Muribaculaceae bacterium]